MAGRCRRRAARRPAASEAGGRAVDPFAPTSQGALPISVITGFLGSGKTTLLSHLLRQPDMGNSAVIVNEIEVGLIYILW